MERRSEAVVAVQFDPEDGRKAFVRALGQAGAAKVTVIDVFGQDTPVSGKESTQDLMVKFGVKSSNYSISSITPSDVFSTFIRVSNYLKGKSTATVNSTTGSLGNITMGDYVNLKSLTVAAYNGNGGNFDRTNTDLAGENESLRLMVVGINPYSGKNDNGTSTPHLIFHFRGHMEQARMESTSTNENGYLGSEMRKYLTPVDGVPGSGNYWTALKASGVPESVVWKVSRRVANKGNADGTHTIEDYLWLPTEREMFGPSGSSYSPPFWSNTTYETNTNQGYFAYYNSDAKRIKSSDNRITVGYWLASPQYYYVSIRDTDFCCANAIDGVNSGAFAIGRSSVVPAFAVK
ncbi:MAG: DUF6273 domain-containing protein [Spirochaetaceae bacterium]|jgi:hypothetical protein|nr:DUF6273 domain-containing protein [Spirochaetaceae bacterium]